MTRPLKQLFRLGAQNRRVEEGAVLLEGVELAVRLPKGFARVQIAQLNIPPGQLLLKLQKGTERPQAADQRHLLLRVPDPMGDADRFQIDRDHPVRPHLKRQVDRHVVVVAAVHVAPPINFLGLKGREAGCGSHQIFLQFSSWDVLLHQLQRL